MIRWLFCLLCGLVPFVADAANPGSVKGKSYNIGDFAEGGVIFWLTPDQKHGLVCSIIDQTGQPSVSGAADALVAWGDTTTVVGAKADGIWLGPGTRNPGQINTALILASQASPAAAQLCADYSITVNGVTYDDWFLPAIQQLGLMMAERATINATAVAHGGGEFWKTGDANPGGVGDRYWSSFESSTTNAFFQNFSTATQNRSDFDRTPRARRPGFLNYLTI